MSLKSEKQGQVLEKHQIWDKHNCKTKLKDSE